MMRIQQAATSKTPRLLVRDRSSTIRHRLVMLPAFSQYFPAVKMHLWLNAGAFKLCAAMIARTWETFKTKPPAGWAGGGVSATRRTRATLIRAAAVRLLVE